MPSHKKYRIEKQRRQMFKSDGDITVFEWKEINSKRDRNWQKSQDHKILSDIMLERWENLSPDIKERIKNIADMDGGEYDCFSDLRIANLNDPIQLAEYVAAISCCGNVDIKIVVDLDTIILYGFNYGH